ncbi:putative AMID-like mitochondrial oxidoreductase [Lophiostoma macrostomum CBS 122681]|uniref:Putative AMID-like mitochondrial oxidoreductase n=1 Tax=Lophiostoma macrostomum CBS 122681 TaxID=1314788 RepID=A0A6A6TI60_9PLEO|nr:putative AMID-like mitochondrial oxidoreductase [Lophiostoma macrostomum CBS 122681]
MVWDKLRLLRTILTLIIPYSFTLVRQKLSSLHHYYTYKPLSSSASSSVSSYNNVIVIGGSFAGYQVAKRLTQTLPTSYRVILVEKNSHLNYLFAFPRFSVLRNRDDERSGLEKYAFIPYSGLTRGAPEGIIQIVQDTATGISSSHVHLAKGEQLPYAYLVLATGTSSPPPSKLSWTESSSGIQQLRNMQDAIFAAKRIAVVGGGAVGVELSADIKSYYPGKHVLLIHSRKQLMSGFGKRLHDFAIQSLGELGVVVCLGERPGLPAVDEREKKALKFSDGRVEEYDLIIPTTGQTPNSTLLYNLSPTSISKSTSRILVHPTLQIIDSSYPHVFALGDVAETGGPKMARAAHSQSEIAVANILRLISVTQSEPKVHPELKPYKPNFAFEGSIKLTLGKKRLALYMQEENGREVLVSLNGGSDDMGVKMQWRFFGADLKALERESGDVVVDGSAAQKIVEATI